MKNHAPATIRNSAAIAEILERELPASGTVLEIASGTGEHAVYLSRRFPNLIWQPSDLEPDALLSINAWGHDSGLANLNSALCLDAAKGDWPQVGANAIFCCNMVHISPWATTFGLFKGAAAQLRAGEPLVLYGPFIEAELDTAPSNIEFDRSLQSRNPQWGLRDIDAVDRLAGRHEFTRTARYEMPANNLTLVYRKNQPA